MGTPDSEGATVGALEPLTVGCVVGTILGACVGVVGSGVGKDDNDGEKLVLFLLVGALVLVLFVTGVG